jgi:hypothetical protein
MSPNIAPPPTLIRLMTALIGGILGLIIVIALGFAILFLTGSLIEAIFGPIRVVRVGAKAGLILIVVPLAGAVWGFVVGWNFHEYGFGTKLRPYLSIDHGSMLDRAWMAWAAIWTIILTLIILMRGAFWRNGYYWHANYDALPTFLWWLFPIVGGFLMSRIFAWVMRGTR